MDIEQTYITQHFKILQTSLDEMTAYFIKDTGNTPGATTILELMEWIKDQMQSGESKKWDMNGLNMVK